MDHIRTILVSILLLLVTGAVTGVPVALHLCCHEPVEVACAPEACCDEGDEDSCCDTQVSVDGIDGDATMAGVSVAAPILHVIDLVPVATVAADHDPFVLGSRACSEAHPPSPPDRSVLSIYLI